MQIEDNGYETKKSTPLYAHPHTYKLYANIEYVTIYNTLGP